MNRPILAKPALFLNSVSGVGLIGFPLLLTPLIWLFKPLDAIALAKPVVFLQGVIFYALASVFVFLLAKKFLKKKAALLITVFFNLYPYLLYYGLKLLAGQNPVIIGYIRSRFLQLMFLLVLADPLSTVLVLGCLLLLFKVLEGEKTGLKRCFLLGILTAWAVICRLQLILFLPFCGSALLLRAFYKKSKLAWQGLLCFVLAGLPLILVQAVINLGATGSWLGMGYKMDKGVTESIPMISLKYVGRLFSYPLKYSPFLLLIIFSLFFLIGLGFYRLIKEKPKLCLVLAGYLIF